MSSGLPLDVVEQMAKAGLPTAGQYPFDPQLVTNKKGQQIIAKKAVLKGPKKGKKGYVDTQGRIWVKDWAHGNLPAHWDVQLNDGDDYLRVDLNGNAIP